MSKNFISKNDASYVLEFISREVKEGNIAFHHNIGYYFGGNDQEKLEKMEDFMIRFTNILNAAAGNLDLKGD